MDYTDFLTRLFKKTGGRYFYLILDTIASKVFMANGNTVEVAVNSVQNTANTALYVADAAQNTANTAYSAAQTAQQTADLKLDRLGAAAELAGTGLTVAGGKINVDNDVVGGTFIYDGTIDFDDPEQVGEIREGKPVGAIVAYDCCPAYQAGNDPVYINAAFNDELWITESGDFEVPHNGIYRVLCIGGGNGAVVNNAPGHCSSGDSGAYVEKDVYLSKGEIVPVAVGAAGIGDAAFSSLAAGGQTSFGEYVTTAGSNRKFGRLGVHVVNVSTGANTSKAEFPGPGLGGVIGNGAFYGAGGGARLQVSSGGAVLDRIAGNGAQGAVRLRFHNPDKDPNISIDMGTATTIR